MGDGYGLRVTGYGLRGTGYGGWVMGNGKREGGKREENMKTKPNNKQMKGKNGDL